MYFPCAFITQHLPVPLPFSSQAHPTHKIWQVIHTPTPDLPTTIGPMSIPWWDAPTWSLQEWAVHYITKPIEFRHKSGWHKSGHNYWWIQCLVGDKLVLFYFIFYLHLHRIQIPPQPHDVILAMSKSGGIQTFRNIHPCCNCNNP